MTTVKIMSLVFVIIMCTSIAIGACISYANDGMPFSFHMPFFQRIFSVATVVSTIAIPVICIIYTISKISDVLDED